MRIKIIEIEINRALSRSGLPDIDYSLNPYLGCSHGCLYCYAKMYTTIREVVDNWGGVVVVKKNLVDVLTEEIKKIKKSVVGIGTITDPYQPVESIYKLTRKTIEVLSKHDFKMSIQTKSSLILRDIDLLKKHKNLVDVGITITSTSNNSFIKLFEPYSSPPLARIETLKKLSAIGIKTWIFYGPIIPGYNDTEFEIKNILRLAKETKSIVYIDKLRIKKFMWLDPFLKNIAVKSYRYDWHRFYDNMKKFCDDIGVECRHGFEDNETNLTMGKKLDEYINNEFVKHKNYYQKNR